MNYIIDPRIFYWISVLSSLKVVCIVGLFVTLFGTMITLTCVYDDFLWNDEDKKKAVKFVKVAAAFATVFLLGVIFIPGKQTMIEMLVAKMATEQNVELTADAVKKIVDYIIQASKAVR